MIPGSDLNGGHDFLRIETPRNPSPAWNIVACDLVRHDGLVVGQFSALILSSRMDEERKTN